MAVDLTSDMPTACQYDKLQWIKDTKGSPVMIGAGNFGKVMSLALDLVCAGCVLCSATSAHVLQVHLGILNRQHRVAIKTLQSESMAEIHRFEAVSFTCHLLHGCCASWLSFSCKDDNNARLAGGPHSAGSTRAATHSEVLPVQPQAREGQAM